MWLKRNRSLWVASFPHLPQTVATTNLSLTWRQTTLTIPGHVSALTDIPKASKLSPVCKCGTLRKVSCTFHFFWSVSQRFVKVICLAHKGSELPIEMVLNTGIGPRGTAENMMSCAMSKQPHRHDTMQQAPVPDQRKGNDPLIPQTQTPTPIMVPQTVYLCHPRQRKCVPPQKILQEMSSIPVSLS